MRTTILKWASIGSLLLVAVFWNYAATYQAALNFIVTIAAAAVLIQAYQQSKFYWATAFLFVAVLFNPAMPAFGLSGAWSFWSIMLTLASFAISLIALRSRPLLSIASITDRNPGSQSL
jgi:hypothetical protein